MTAQRRGRWPFAVGLVVVLLLAGWVTFMWLQTRPLRPTLGPVIFTLAGLAATLVVPLVVFPSRTCIFVSFFVALVILVFGVMNMYYPIIAKLGDEMVHIVNVAAVVVSALGGALTERSNSAAGQQSGGALPKELDGSRR